MNPSATQARRLDACAHAVADPTRRGLLRLVRDTEVPAGELARHFPAVSRPAVSQHLRVLERAELVTVRRAGNRRLYRSNPAAMTDLREFIDDLWTDRLGRLKVAAEQAHAKTRR